jgi:hypothetical protein
MQPKENITLSTVQISFVRYTGNIGFHNKTTINTMISTTGNNGFLKKTKKSVPVENMINLKRL